MSSRRSGRKNTSNRRKKAQRQQMMIIGGLGLVIVIFIGLVIYNISQNSNLPGEKLADLGNTHLDEEPTEYVWNSRPPTSGPHAPSTASWGVHTESVPEWYQIHNLEDGGVIVHYNCPDGCAETVDQLEEIIREVDPDMDHTILHPYPDMDSTIAVTAWTRMITMDSVDKNEISEFIDSYIGKDHHK